MYIESLQQIMNLKNMH